MDDPTQGERFPDVLALGKNTDSSPLIWSASHRGSRVGVGSGFAAQARMSRRSIRKACHNEAGWESDHP
jgi:hypothetical protein